MVEQHKYPGRELPLFEKATNWKKYFTRLIRKYIKNKVLEVGAGLGASTILLNDSSASEWILLEPDEHMAKELEKKISGNYLPSNCKLLKGTLKQLPADIKFDTILYVDVLEHIKDDKEELEKASEFLKEGGCLVVLVPAFQFLYSRFDDAIGHYRRYSATQLKQIIPSGMNLVKINYLDTTGFFSSLANRLLLKQSYPTAKQISFWDKLMIPVSKITDHIFFHSFGKTILAIWKKNNNAATGNRAH
jgi:ubiquinone/menaquinone biosynthesis C-methylase UbiE